ncbi:hypothetical protein K0M31_016119 [Melipona bicolor]|uniref:Uncharacterized protein n=1 Tax=Melipona bicolor TaxID=60889 RepID=A0AA40G6F5_9HYME|nr:hypothetical protein K0M31_016119 [Melipona bicolor]
MGGCCKEQPSCSELRPILITEERTEVIFPFSWLWGVASARWDTKGECLARGVSHAFGRVVFTLRMCSGELSSRRNPYSGELVLRHNPVFGGVGLMPQSWSRALVPANQNSREHTAHLERLAFETRCHQFSAGPPPSSTGRMRSPAARRFTNPSAAPTDRARVMPSFPKCSDTILS